MIFLVIFYYRTNMKMMKCFSDQLKRSLWSNFLLEATQSRRYNVKLHDPNRRKMGLSCFEMTFEWYAYAMVFCVFIFIFMFRSNVIRSIRSKQLPSLSWFFFSKVSFRKYLITTMFKVLYQQFWSTLTAAFERHLTTEDFMDIRVKPAPTHLTYYCMLLFISNKPSF